ncbi:MAG: M28 family peptidase [Gemmatimonadota bacterium]|nr:M28 family peptidase [Gemmatimonadota bacterium]
MPDALVPRSGARRAATAAGLIALCALAVIYADQVPRPLGASAAATVFSAERAMRHVRAIAQRPHPAGSEDHARVRAYLVTELTALGLTPEVQEATGVGTRYSAGAHVANVLARVPGAHPGGPAVLLVAHYDGVPAGPAAGDDAAGSAVLLETVRALRADTPLAHDVIVLFTDAEETGLVGAAAFAREHPWAKDAGVILNFEARGTSGPSWMFETGAGNLDVARMLRGVPGIRATSLATAVYRMLPNDTDLSELAVLDRPALNFAFIGRVDRYHTEQDDVGHLSAASVQHHGINALALARALGNGELPRPRTSDAVFFDVPGLGLIVYRESWALPLAIFAALLVIVALARLRGRDQRLARSVVIGVAGTLVAVAIAGVAGSRVAYALTRMHERMAGGGAAQWSQVYAAAIVMLAIALVGACYAAMRRWAGGAGARVGVMLLWAAISIAVAAKAPLMSFLFPWPLIAVALAMLSARGEAAVWKAQGAEWAAALVAIVIVVPNVYGTVCIALGLDQTSGAMLGIFTALTLLLLMPLLESLAGARWWSAPLWALGAAVTLFAAGAATLRTNTEHPAKSSLAYAIDPDSGGVWLTGFSDRGVARSWLRRVFETSGQAKDAPPAWLRHAFDERLAGFARARSWGTVAGPIIDVLGDTTIDGARRVTLRIHVAPRALAVLMDADSGAVLSAAIDGRAIDTRRYRHHAARWSLDYAAPPDSGFVLALRLRPGTHPVLDVMVHIDGVAGPADPRIPPRPPGVLRAQNGDMTLVHRAVKL